MKINSVNYYLIVLVIFSGILFSVRYIVNTNRIIIGSEESINPVEIYWEVDDEDSILRLKDPLYVDKTFVLSKNQCEKFKKDSLISSELFVDTVPNEGALINLKPPYVLWKSGMNDTIKVFKYGRSLNFVKY
jgi:hypothetical protein